MTPIRKPTKPIPASIFKLGAATPETFALFIHLDGMPYCEVKCKRMADFTQKLFEWKRENLPSLRSPVVVRYFLRTNKNLDIQEVKI